jgi:5-methylcytosine-specific restriction endonuclease McrA
MWSKEKRREYHLAYYHKRRKLLISLLGGECVQCGAKVNLNIDHIDPTKKSINFTKTLSLDVVLEELGKCQLLCVKCHKKKTSIEHSGFTHGTYYGWFKKKCSCEACLKAKRAWHDKRNARRRKGAGYRPRFKV